MASALLNDDIKMHDVADVNSGPFYSHCGESGMSIKYVLNGV